MFSRFGRQIFKLYETRPLVMNSVVGGMVYVAGEYSVQTQTKDVRFFDSENWSKLGQLGALGATENGLVMMKWYSFLSRFIGNSVSTHVVLLKCLLDQVFFATQQDLLFLGLCAYNDTVELDDAVTEVKESFLTTWIVDCSLWPVVNFAGFAFVPVVLQPTYMAFVSYFWQLYLSRVAATNKEVVVMCDEELEQLFKELDTDNSQYIDAIELQTYFRNRGVIVTQGEVRQMIADADQVGRNIQTEVGTPEEQVCSDGKVSLDEFKRIATHGDTLHLKTSALWASVRHDVELSYGSKHARNRLENLKISTAGQDVMKISTAGQDVIKIGTAGGGAGAPPNKSADSSTMLTNRSSTSGITNQPSGAAKSAATDNTTANTSANNTTVSIANSNTTAKTTAIAPTPVSTPLLPTDNPVPVPINVSAPHVSSKEQEATEEEEMQQRKIALAGARTAAIEKASVGGAILTVAVLIRRLVFKI